MAERALILFARDPVLGEVKRRLAADSSDELALKVYGRMLERTLRLCRAFGRRMPATRVRLAVTDAAPCGRLMRAAQRWDLSIERQRGGDLGERMNNALQHAFDAGARRAVLIGSDCPELTLADLRAAFEALHAAPAVIAPVSDGGYCLVGTLAGASEARDALFRSIPWSTPEVAALTRARCAQAAVRLAELRELSDVDRLHDWRRWCASRAARGLAEDCG